MNTRAAWLVVVLLTLLMAASGAMAQTAVLTRQAATGFAPVAGGGYVRVVSAFSDPVTARIWASAGAGWSGTLSAADSVGVTARGLAPLAVTSTAAVTMPNAAAAVARCLIGGGPLVCGVASTAATAYAAYRVYKDASGTAGEHDPGQATELVYKWNTTCFNGTGEADTAEESFDKACAAGAALNSTGNYTYTAPTGTNCTVNGNSSSCSGNGTYVCVNINNGAPCGSGSQLMNGNGSRTQVSRCPAVIDALNPAYNISAGLPPGADGKCPTARYNRVPITVADAVAKVQAFPPASGAMPTWRDGLKDAIETGGETVPATITTTGPASQTGAPTTTTTTSSGTTTTKTATPTYNYTYNQSNITYTTTVTTITNTGGTVTSTETTNAPPTEDKDYCLTNPTRAGCSQLGTPPTDTVPWQDKPVTYSQETGVGVAGSCPPDRTFTFHTWALPLKYGPACDAAPFARIAILVCAAISAMALITRTVTS